MCKLVLVVLIAATTTVSGITVGTKLDFGEEHRNPDKIVYIHTGHDTTHDSQDDDDFDKVGVVCISGGCNTTKTKPEATDSIAADIVVQVKTNIDVNTNKTKSMEEEVPDVPIVIGYGGVSNNPNTNINPPDNALNPNPIVITNLENSFHGNHVKNGNGFLPSLGVNIEIKPPVIVREDNDYKENSVWYPRVNYNPLGFNRPTRPDWRISHPWFDHHHRRPDYDYNRHNRPTSPPGWTTNCRCHYPNNNGWQPTTAPYNPQNTAGTQINDKLGSFN